VEVVARNGTRIDAQQRPELVGHDTRHGKSMKRVAIVVLALPMVSVRGALPVPAPTGAESCLGGSGPLVTISGAQAPYHDESLAYGTRIDARSATWVGQGQAPVKVGGNGACWSGGRIVGTFPDSTSYDAMHDTYGIVVFSPNMVIEHVRIHNYGDGISFDVKNDSNWTIRSSHFSYLRDDCIENDFLNSGLVEDSFYDGCYNVYSARTYGHRPHRDGSDHVVTIRNTLMRLQPMPTVYTGPAPGHARFFKLDRAGISPKLALYDNIFRVDQLPSLGSPHNGMYFIPPPEKLAGCANNVIVWLGPGRFPEPLPSCFTLTQDKGVWDKAAAQWLAAHPEVQP
jgi:hypothetical protein